MKKNKKKNKEKEKRRRRRGEKKKKRIEMRLMPRLLFEKDENHTSHSANLKKKLSTDWSIFMHVVCISIWFTFARRHNLVMTNPSRICRNQNNIMSNTPLFCITLANIDLLQVRRKPRNNMTDMRKVGSKPSSANFTDVFSISHRSSQLAESNILFIYNEWWQYLKFCV